ncbi:hypothetical protein AXF42_Ash018096 [Apostasia shenzhenica]|uniref:Uncharacterized protein n=1 Tax=Apostasia shenzhenica TaxID=1088818 RepID=A0A2I0AVS3_9ASPA|nr:hypothetical protein AXF42_Ash018096 [Apostasia shenzhenica]
MYPESNSKLQIPLPFTASTSAAQSPENLTLDPFSRSLRTRKKIASLVALVVVASSWPHQPPRGSSARDLSHTCYRLSLLDLMPKSFSCIMSGGSGWFLLSCSKDDNSRSLILFLDDSSSLNLRFLLSSISLPRLELYYSAVTQVRTSSSLDFPVMKWQQQQQCGCLHQAGFVEVLGIEVILSRVP